jgi:hypothetical protein
MRKEQLRRAKNEVQEKVFPRSQTEGLEMRSVVGKSCFVVRGASRALPLKAVRCYFPNMSTLAEIEAAAAALPPEQKQELMLFLAARLRTESARALEQTVPFRPSKRGFPISKGRQPFTSEDVARIEVEADL